MNRIDRLFAILITLQSKKYVTADAIAEKFGMSVRTVYRDIKALTETGVPVSFESQKGYFIMQGYFLPPISFSSEEANALLLIESITSRFSDQSIAKHYATALRKVKAVLRGSQKDRLEQLEDQIASYSPCGQSNDFAFLADLQHAVAIKHIVKMQYRNLAGEVSEREIEPIGLLFYSLNWHVIAWCKSRQAYRDFRASRILHLQVTERCFEKKEHINISEYTARLDQLYAMNERSQAAQGFT